MSGPPRSSSSENSSSRFDCSARTPEHEEGAETDRQQDDAGLVPRPLQAEHGVAQREHPRFATAAGRRAPAPTPAPCSSSASAGKAAAHDQRRPGARPPATTPPPRAPGSPAAPTAAWTPVDCPQPLHDRLTRRRPAPASTHRRRAAAAAASRGGPRAAARARTSSDTSSPTASPCSTADAVSAIRCAPPKVAITESGIARSADAASPTPSSAAGQAEQHDLQRRRSPAPAGSWRRRTSGSRRSGSSA